MLKNKTITFKEAEDYHTGLILLTNAIESSQEGVGLDLIYLLNKAIKNMESDSQSMVDAKKQMLEVYGTLEENGTLTLSETSEDVVASVNKDLNDFYDKSDEFSVIKDKINIKDIKHLRLKPSFLVLFDKYLEGLEEYEWYK